MVESRGLEEDNRVDKDHLNLLKNKVESLESSLAEIEQDAG